MKRAALGVRMHSGWGVLVGVCGDSDSVEVVERRRIVVIVPKMTGAAQPYHHAKLIFSGELGVSRPSLAKATTTAEAGGISGALRGPKGPLFQTYPSLQGALAAAEKHLADCASVSERLALAAIGEVVRELKERDYRVVGCAVLLASGRPLPGLEKILGSHPLIHTAEGEFFRDAVRRACEGLGISVAVFPEREVGERVKAAFGKAAGGVERRIAGMGRLVGAPWTRDHKAAAQAALVVLGGR
jgi:hypothetical protein